MRVAYLVTGTTKGLGKAIAEEVVQNGDWLYSLSSDADCTTPAWTNLCCDLKDALQVTRAFGSLLAKMRRRRPRAMVLVNNAAVIEPIGSLDMAEAGAIAHHVAVNAVAPALLMAGFIAPMDDFGGPRHVINISSGAALYPYAGWSLYCATKAALDMMTLCTAMDLQSAKGAVSVCAVYPGKVDTPMQTAIRRAGPDRFAKHADFVQAHRRGDLSRPHDVARRLIQLYRDGALRNGGIYDIRTMHRKDGRWCGDPVRSIGSQS